MLDGNNTIDTRDYVAMLNGPKNDRTVINGDGKTDNSDLILLNDFLTKKRKYRHAWWDVLQTIQERKDWVLKMIAIDQTDKIKYVPHDFDCDTFADETCMNFGVLKK